MTNLKLTRRALGALAVALSFGTTAMAQDYTIRYATPYPPNHIFSRADQAYFAKVEEDSGGRVKFQPYWAGALISSREGMDQLATGVADMAFIAPIYSRSGKDITKSMSGWLDPRLNPVQKVELFWRLWDKYPALRAEYEDVHLIAAHAGDNMHIQTADRAVRSVEDLAGLRLKATGESVTVLNELGAAAVAMPMGEVYVALQKGILDGTVAPYETLIGFKFAEVVKYYTKIPMPRSAYGSRAMNLDSWNALPEDIQKILSDNSMFWAEQIDAFSAAQDVEGLEFGKAQGVEFIEPDEATLEAVIAAQNKIWSAQAKALDDMGLPGTAIMEDLQAWGKEMLDAAG